MVHLGQLLKGDSTYQMNVLLTLCLDVRLQMWSSQSNGSEPLWQGLLMNKCVLRTRQDTSRATTAMKYQKTLPMHRLSCIFTRVAA